MPEPAAATEEIRISAPLDDQSQLIAHIYARGFQRFGRQATVLPDPAPTDPFEPLDTRAANFTFTCTGLHLEQVLPEKAAEFEKEAAADPNIETKLEDKQTSASALSAEEAATGNDAPSPVAGGTEFRDKVYAAFLGTLPGEFAGGPRGLAQGCDKDPKKNIPYDIVPVFVKPTVSEYLNRYLLAPIGGWLSQDELDDMTAKLKNGDDPEVLAALFLDKHQIHP